MDRAYFLGVLLVVAFLIQQTYLWALLIKWRRHVLYPTPVILWSLFFMGHLHTLVFPSLINLPVVLFLLIQLLIGWLLFPRIEGLDYNSSYTYIDVYEEFRQQHAWVFGMSILGELFLLYQQSISTVAFTFSSFLYLFLFIAAFFTEHKGLMLLWVWLGLGVLWFL